MSRSQKQMIVLDYLLIKFPNITVGEAGRMLKKWEHKTGNVLNVKA